MRIDRSLAAAAALTAGLWLLIASAPAFSRQASEAPGRPAPDFPTSDPNLWINSAPLTMEGLRGKVIVLDVWTYG